MKKIFAALFAVCLLTATLARADNTWGPFTGSYLSDGGNDPGAFYGPYGGPASLLATGNHGIRSIPSYPIGVTTFGATWGTVSNSDTQGTDSDFSINFYSGTAALDVLTNPVFTINFGQVWGAASQSVPDGGAAVPMFGGVCYYQGAGAATGPATSAYYLVQTSTTTAAVYATTAFTPASTTNYHFACHVFNLGSPY